MKNRKLIDLYLTPKWGYHVRLVLFSGIFTLITKIALKQELYSQGTLILFFLLVIQLELFIWMGGKFFANIRYKTVHEYARKAIFRLILFFFCAFVISVIIYSLTLTVVFLMNDQDLSGLIPHLLKTESKGFVIGAGIGYAIGALIFFYFQWIDALKREQKLREEKLIFQYETLKNQVNPHFLFNSLNTLCSLVSKDVSLSEEYIHKLSSIYRYILENKDLDHVSLKRELDFVEDYFYLQKVRDDGKIELELRVPDADKYEILPISLQLLVENAFKHNVASKSNPLKIRIALDDGKERISVSNNVSPKTHIEGSSKIGLINLSERNKLITGKEIEVIDRDTEFKVMIPLIKSIHEGIDH